LSQHDRTADLFLLAPPGIEPKKGLSRSIKMTEKHIEPSPERLAQIRDCIGRCWARTATWREADRRGELARALQNELKLLADEAVRHVSRFWDEVAADARYNKPSRFRLASPEEHREFARQFDGDMIISTLPLAPGGLPPRKPPRRRKLKLDTLVEAQKDAIEAILGPGTVKR
jgi:hypothetical protein